MNGLVVISDNVPQADACPNSNKNVFPKIKLNL